MQEVKKEKKKKGRARNKECGVGGGGGGAGAGIEKNNHASQWTGHLNSAMLRLSVPEIRKANNF